MHSHLNCSTTLSETPCLHRQHLPEARAVLPLGDRARRGPHFDPTLFRPPHRLIRPSRCFPMATLLLPSPLAFTPFPIAMLPLPIPPALLETPVARFRLPFPLALLVTPIAIFAPPVPLASNRMH